MSAGRIQLEKINALTINCLYESINDCTEKSYKRMQLKNYEKLKKLKWIEFQNCFNVRKK